MTTKKAVCLFAVLILALLVALSACAYDRDTSLDDNNFSGKTDKQEQISGVDISINEEDDNIEQTSEGDINKNENNKILDKVNEGDLDMSLVNLRDIDENENKRIVDVLLEKLTDYPHLCTQKNFSFKKSISNFVLVSTDDNEISGITSTTAYYRLKNNPDEEDYNAVIYIYFCATKEESHNMIKDYLDSYTMIEVYASDLEVGDFALGGIYRVDFVRGNIYIAIEGYDDVEIDELAKEIDLQILQIINKK